MMNESKKMEMIFGLITGRASSGFFEKKGIVIVFGWPGQKPMFEIIYPDRPAKIASPAGIAVLQISLLWFWMQPFAPENIDIKIENALFKALQDIEIEAEDGKTLTLIEKREKLERKIEKRLEEKFGEKSTVKIKIEIQKIR